MRLHSDTLTREDIYAAVREGLPGVYVTVTEHGSQSHARAFEVSLTGNGARRNSGRYGASDEHAATWDEWGVFLARLYVRDPGMLAGRKSAPVYRNAEHYHWETGGRFRDDGLPTDSHPRHTWRFQGTAVTGAYSVWSCAKCSATKRYGDWERVAS